MKRVRRIIYNGAVALSLLLCLGTVGVWVRSYWVSDQLTWRDWTIDGTATKGTFIHTSRGGLRYSSFQYSGTGLGWGSKDHFLYSREAPTRYPRFDETLGTYWEGDYGRLATLGFELVPKTEGKLGQFGILAATYSLTLPLYFPTLLFALLPAHYFLRVRRRRRIAVRRAQGCCISCGYDLRASTGRCPECGREMSAAK